MQHELTPEVKSPKKGLTLANQILLGMVLGILVGYFFPSQSVVLKPIGDVFLRMIKMIVVPLIFAGLIMGIAGAGDYKRVGRIGLKAIIWFELATTVALTYGLVLANVIQPGAGVAAALGGDTSAVTQYAMKSIDLVQFVVEIVPTNIVDALSQSKLLQVVCFSCFFGVAVAAIGERGKVIIDFSYSVMYAMFKVTNYVMNLSPIGVFSFMAYTIGKYGIAMMIPLGKLVLTVYGGLIIFVITVLAVACAIIKMNFLHVLRVIRQPLLIAFTTASSEAALPLLMAKLEKFGVPRHIVNFVLPTGYSFNMDGASIYYCMAVVFIAQVYGIPLTFSDQFLILITMMLMSKGAAGVSGGALIIIAGVLTMFNLPMEGLFLILGVDRFIDMGRTATNVAGNAIATFVVARWEKELPDELIRQGYTKDYEVE